MENQVTVLKALAHLLRLQVADWLLDEEEICVCEMAKRLNTSQSNLSRHLNLLKNAGILSSRKEGLKVFYSLRDRHISCYLICLRGLAAAQSTRKEQTKDE